MLIRFQVLQLLLYGSAKLLPQTSTSPLITFISPDRSFAFTFQATNALYTPGKMDEAKALFYIPPCSDGAMVCVTLQPKKYAATNFGVASFEVVVTPAQNEKACVTPRVNDDTPEFTAAKGHHYQRVNGVRFLRATRGGAAMGHCVTRDIYRAFQNGKCYSLTTSIAAETYGLRVPPGPKFTDSDRQEVRKSLDRMLDSFRFLK